MMEYNHYYDIAIAKALYKYGSVGRRSLKMMIESKEYLGKKIAFSVFYYHIKKMLDNGYIIENKYEWKRGRTSTLSLSSLTHQQVRLNTLTIQYPQITRKEEIKNIHSYTKLKKRSKKTENIWRTELRHKRICYLIICIAAYDTPNKSYNYPGISVTDVLSARYDGHAFWYLRLENNGSMIEKCFNSLLKLGVVTRIKTPQNESRYKLVDPDWKEFIESCLVLLEGAIMNWLHLIWSNIRPPTPTERLYYESCWGKRNADFHLRTVYSDSKKDNPGRLNKTNSKGLLDMLSINIHRFISRIEEKYCRLSIEHPSLYKTIFETIFPYFVRNEVRKIYRKGVINDGKKYPKLKIVSI